MIPREREPPGNSLIKLIRCPQTLHDAVLFQIPETEVRKQDGEDQQHRRADDKRQQGELEGGVAAGCEGADDDSHGEDTQDVGYHQCDSRVI